MNINECFGWKTFVVWNADAEDGEASARTVLASDAERAAELWAESDDARSADYSIARGNDAWVRVRSKSGTITTFLVSGRSEPIYKAKEIS